VFVFKLFSYKDYINNLIQYDENWFYFSDKKVRITTEQSQIIKLLERNGEFTSNDLNKIVSKDKKYAKSHLTLLRKKLY
jgi:predicted HTH transcriptional regulator